MSDAAAEAARRFPYRPGRTVNDFQQDIFREVFIAGAEWAAPSTTGQENER